MSKNNVINRLTGGLQKINEDSIPDTVIEIGKNCIIDTVGVTIAGSVTSSARKIYLSATETFFPEKRPFFLEGQDVFVATPRASIRSYGGRYMPLCICSCRHPHHPCRSFRPSQLTLLWIISYCLASLRIV